MQKKFAPTLVAAIAALTLTSFAATPVAVWDGDFGTSVKTGTDGKTYTLVLPSGADSWVQSDGTLKIGSGTQSAYINLQNGSDHNLAQGTKISVLLEYANATAQTGAAPIYLQADSYFGLKTKESSLDVVGDNWGTTYPTSGDAVTTMPSDGCILMVYPQGSGNVKVYSASTRAGLSDSSAGGEIGGLKFSNKYLQKIGIGGTFTSGSAQNLKNFENLVIKKVAVFTSAIATSDAASYVFPSEVQTINIDANTTVSDINELYDSSNYKAADVTVANGVTITVDAAFSAEIRSVSSTGSVTLSADTQPDDSYLSGVEFNVQGALLRSWLTPGVVGVNFVKNYGNVVDDELVTSGSWVETEGASGSSTSLFADGLTKLTWSSGGVYSYFNNDNENASFLHGYLDDGNNKGNGVEIYIDNVPYATYDVVIYASTDTQNVKFRAKSINNVTYTMATGSVAEGDAVWGTSRLETPDYGSNAMRIKNLTGSLTIYGGLNNGSRGGIAAIQIMPPTAEDNITEYTLALDGSARAHGR